MKNLLVFASAVLIGASALASAQPRVYQYSASLKATVAKNAAKVKLADGSYLENVCYRTKGSLSLKGVAVFGCFCNELEGWQADYMDYNYGWEEAVPNGNGDFTWGTIPSGYPFFLVGTSADKYKTVVFAEYFDFWTANRFGNPLSAKAKDAELAFDLDFTMAGYPTNSCGRYVWVEQAGFGEAGVIESADGSIDITSISGNVVGETSAPFCSAADNNCPRCLVTGNCQEAIAFRPCFDDSEYGTGAGDDYDVVYGSFTFKYNKTLSNSIKDVAETDVQATVNALVPKVFGTGVVAPTVPVAD